MKTRLHPTLRTAHLALGVLLLSTLNSQLSTVLAQSTAFTYQGRLNDGANPANGSYDVRFALFQNATGGGALLGPMTNSAVAASNGLFTATADFGPFDPDINVGRGKWLEVSVRTNGSGAFITLSPRQLLTPTPYATFANYSGAIAPGFGLDVTGISIFNPVSGPPFYVGNSNLVPGLNAELLGGLTASAFWKLGGNSGTIPGANFVGTTDAQPLDLRVNNQRAYRLEPGLVDANHGGINVIGGASENFVAPGTIGATIAGGGADNFFLGPLSNTVSGSFGTVSGGFQNIVSQFASTVAGGRFNVCNNEDSAIGGGFGNTNSAFAATIPGGYLNLAAGTYSLAAGQRAKANHQGSFVWSDSQSSDFSSTANDQFSVRAQGGVRVIGQLTASGGAGNGVEGHSTSSIASGVYGQSDGGGYGVAGRTTGTGSAIFGDNVNANGWAGDFNGKVRCISLTQTSDRNVKQDFAPVNARMVLGKVAVMPISQWKFKTDPGTPHLGPMAQDFYAAFGLGDDDKHIAVVDEGGVALAAIQGLNQKVEDQRTELERKTTEITELKQRLAALEKIIRNQKSN